MSKAVDKMKRDVARIKQEQAEEERAGAMQGKPSNDDEGGEDKELEGDQEEQHEEQEQEEQPKFEIRLTAKDKAQYDRAIAAGWKPPEEWEGDPEDFIRPSEFMRTVALYKRIDHEREERERLQSEVDTFGDRIKNVMEVAKAKAIAELEEQRDQAIEDADHKEVRRIDKEIKQTEKDFEVEETASQAPKIRPELADWFDENPWFDTNQDMATFALAVQQGQLSRLPDPQNPTSEQLKLALKRTKNAVRNEFPDHFKKTPRYQAQELERGKRTPSKKKFGYNDLTEQEKTVLEDIERLPGGMSRDEYIQACADQRTAE